MTLGVVNRQKRAAIYYVFFGALAFRFSSALMSDFLNIWDEQFHALAAKNMATTPFTPRLYPQALIPYIYEDWSTNYIWLHKQPYFLWQMALSIKVFGPTTLATRIPSILMSSAMVFFIADIGKKLGSKEAGFIGAVAWSLSFFSILLPSGLIHTDHNDVAFVFLVTGSIWSWLRYEENPRFKRALWIGIWVGLAILTKWLVGLGAFLVWGIYLLIKKEWKLSPWVHMLTSLLVVIAIAAPWNLYVYKAFPVEAAIEMKMNATHFTEAVEAHSGPWYFHLRQLGPIYGWFLLPFALWGIVFGMRRKPKSLALLAWVLFMHVFFGIAATKMVAFTYPIASLAFVAIGWGIWDIFQKLQEVGLGPFPLKLGFSSRNWKIFSTAGFLVLGILVLNPLKIAKSNSLSNEFRRERFSIAQMSKALQAAGKANHTIVIELPDNTHPLLMYYSDAIGYDFRPNPTDLKTLKQTGKRILRYDSESKTLVPEI
ncbi:MAG: hypothetical protein SchgKO_02710 [Schleiferiaceae bacterium]